MRTKLTLLALAALVLTQAGCANGFRIGGNHFGAGTGGYIGPVPDVVKPDNSYYLPPPPPAGVEIPEPMPKH